MTPEEFGVALGVSRETLDRFEAYVGLLVKWQKAINLVSPNTLGQLWTRHMLNSAQLFPMIPDEAETVLDLGSGAGFPGLVLGILAQEFRPNVRFHLIESDQRKATFLREAARITVCPLQVHARRIEDVAAFPADVVTSRALAHFGDLIRLSAPFWHRKTVGLFLKGQNVEAELTQAAEFGTVATRLHPSQTDPAGRILEVRYHSERSEVGQ